MDRNPAFDSPLLLGFEHTRGLIDRAQRASGEAYPPYNVEDLGDGAIRIVIAVAGFTAAQLEITVQGNELTVTGRRETESATERAFMHRGIAARAFVRGFVLADGMAVDRAWLDHGLLNVEARRPEARDTVRRVPIDAA